MNRTMNKTNQSKVNYEGLVIASIAVAVVLTLMPELAMAADAKPDAFATVLDKVNEWVGGSAGKLITVISIIIAAAMGVAGFSIRYILGAIGTGLLLSSANALVNMIF